MSESTNLERITLDSVQQADAKLLYSDDDFVVMNDFKDISTFRGAHVSSYVIIFCKKGKISFTYNHHEDHITTGECFVFVPGSIITDIMMSLEFEGIGVFLTQRLLQGLLHNDINIWNKILYVEKQNKFVAFKSHGENIPDYGKYWKIAAENRNRPFAKQITLSIIHTFLLEMCSIFVDNEEKRGIKFVQEDHIMGKQSQVIFRRFIATLQQEKVKRHPVPYYAGLLNISSKYLTTIVRKESGKSVRNWICEAVDSDITYYLFNTNASIKEISSTLGFPNLSFFGKYVKDHFGQSPRTLRMQAKINKRNSNGTV